MHDDFRPPEAAVDEDILHNGPAIQPVDEISSLLVKNAAPRKLSSPLKTFGNIIISIVGAGVLGLPYTFMQSGWLFSLIAVVFVAFISYYGMILLVRCRKAIHVRHGDDVRIISYGDLGYHVYGHAGRLLVDIMIFMSQAGFCVAYLIFIGTNLSSYLTGGPKYKAQFIWIVAPLQMLLSWLRSLTRLAPFSIFADVVYLLAFGAVLFYDFKAFRGFDEARAFTSVQKIPVILGVAVYAFEGVGVTLLLESSMKDRSKFPATLALALGLISVLYSVFGICGYLGFGDSTQEIITLNLPLHWSTDMVKLGICIALFFTFPVMMEPVYDVYERYLAACDWYQSLVAPNARVQKVLARALRAITVLLVVWVAIAVPNFATFISLVGSSFCSMLGFVLPGLFHLHALGHELPAMDRLGDYALIAFGVCFGLWGTVDSVRNIFFSN